MEALKVLDTDVFIDHFRGLAVWGSVFFPELPVPTDVSAKTFRVALGELLKRHLLFANLLRLLKGRVINLQ